MKVIFMGTPGFAVPALEALGASSHEVIAVYTQPPRPAGRGMKLTPSPVQALADTHGVAVFTPTSLKSTEEQEKFRALDADIAVVAAYGLILPKAILEAPKHGCINIHPSDLPRWRGAAPLQRTIMAGDKNTACCIMQMDEGLDTGGILARKPFPIPAGMTTGELHDAMAKLGAEMVLRVLDNLPQPVPQAKTGATYAAKIDKADQPIDWEKPAEDIVNQIRGLSPMPGAVMRLKDELIKVFAAKAEAGKLDKKPGEVLDEQLLINAGNGTAVRILELQRAGKGRQSASQALLGFPVAPGTYAEKLNSQAGNPLGNR